MAALPTEALVNARCILGVLYEETKLQTEKKEGSLGYHGRLQGKGERAKRNAKIADWQKELGKKSAGVGVSPSRKNAGLKHLEWPELPAAARSLVG